VHRIIGVAGYKNSGKTGIVEGIVKELKSRDYRVATVKHVPEEGFTLDQSETDTWRHAQAGADKVALVSPDEFSILDKREVTLEEVLLSLENLDFVILEGFRSSEAVPKIMVAHDEDTASSLDDDFTVGFVGVGVGEKPVFDREDIESVTNLVEKKATCPTGGLDCGECGFDNCREFIMAAIEGEAPVDGCVTLKGPVSLSVDGRKVPIKPFIKDLLANTISGMISSLKNAEGKKIELEVESDEG